MPTFPFFFFKAYLSFCFCFSIFLASSLFPFLYTMFLFFMPIQIWYNFFLTKYNLIDKWNEIIAQIYNQMTKIHRLKPTTNAPLGFPRARTATVPHGATTPTISHLLQQLHPSYSLALNMPAPSCPHSPIQIYWRLNLPNAKVCCYNSKLY